MTISLQPPHMLATITRVFSDCVFPKFCYGCNTYGAFLCDTCAKTLLIAPAVHIASDSSAVAGYISCGLYQTALLKTLIHQLKYNGIQQLADPLGALLRYGFIQSQTTARVENPLFVPIPLYARRMRERGFNQNELLARVAFPNEMINLAVLTRVRHTKPQATLSREKRITNIHNSFQCNSVPIQENIQTIVLIDDVMTTGATIESAARALAPLKKPIYGLVLAKD